LTCTQLLDHSITRPKRKLTFLFLLICLLLVSCAHKQPPLEERLLVRMSSLYAPKGQPLAPLKQEKETGEPQKTREVASKEIMPLRYHEAPGIRPSIQKLPFSKTKEVSVAVNEMPLPDFIHYIFSDIFGVNYIVDSKVKKSKELVTLNLNQRINERQLFEIVADVLKQHQLSVYVKEDVYYVWKDSKSKDFAIGIGATIDDIPVTVGEIQQIIPIKYVDVQNLFEFLPRDKSIKVIPAIRENMLVVTGTREQIEKVINIVNALDRPAMRGRFAGMLRLKYWSPSDIAAKLKEILTQEGIPVTDNPGRKGIYITKLERWSTILIFAAEKEWLERVKYWVKILDMPLDKDERLQGLRTG